MGNFEEISVIMGCTFRAHSTLVCMPRSRMDRQIQVRCPAVQVNTICSRIFAHQVYMYTKTPRYYHVKRDGQVPNRNSSPFPQAITYRLHQCALPVPPSPAPRNARTIRCASNTQNTIHRTTSHLTAIVHKSSSNSRKSPTRCRPPNPPHRPRRWASCQSDKYPNRGERYLVRGQGPL